MSTLQSEVFDAFRSIGVTEDKAVKAAAALSARDKDAATLKSDLTVMKWMMGCTIALQVVIFVKRFIQ